MQRSDVRFPTKTKLRRAEITLKTPIVNGFGFKHQIILQSGKQPRSSNAPKWRQDYKIILNYSKGEIIKSYLS